MGNFPAIALLINWQPLLPAWLLLPLALSAAAALLLMARHAHATAGRRVSLPLTIMRGLLLLLVLLTLAQPLLQRQAHTDQHRTIIALVDTSASMALPCADGSTRLQQALRALDKVRATAPAAWRWQLHPFVDTMSPAATNAAAVLPDTSGTPTDIPAPLGQADRAALAGGGAAILLISDGGDAPALAPLPLATPLVALGAGDHTRPTPDLAIATITAPPAVERDATFTINAEIKASATPGLLRQPPATRLTLYRTDENGSQTAIATTNAPLAQGAAHVQFTTSCATVGQTLFTIKAAPWGDEKHLCNNERAFAVNVRNSAIKVLFHAHQIGADLKFLRQALASDAAINFAALYSSGGGRFTVHGDAASHETLADGFPAQVEHLRPFGAIIIGSFPVEEWSAAQMGALLAYVEEGGGVIWLGGVESFGDGGYLDSPLSPLLPWQSGAGATTLLRGAFPARVAASANAATAGLADLLANATADETAALHVTSLNRGARLIPGAQPLLLATAGADSAPLAVEHRFGRGRVITVASNTTWLWARTSGIPARFYNLFWRQAVRAVAGSAASGTHLRLAWDRESYRPGEIANLRIQGEGGDNLTLRVTALRLGERAAVPAEAQADANTWLCSWRLTDREPVAIEVALDAAGAHLETCATPIPLAVPPGESSILLPNIQALRTFVEASGGTMADTPEAAAAALWEATATNAATHTFNPFATAWPLIAITLLLASELLLRRRHNLL